MKRPVLFLIFGLATRIALAEPHLGFDLEEARGRLAVSEIYDQTEAASADLRIGDVLINLGGAPVRTAEDVRAFTAKRKPGDAVRVQVKRWHQVVTTKVRVVDKDAMMRQVAEVREAERTRARAEADRQKQLADRLADQGFVSVTHGGVVHNAIGTPRIALTLRNASEQWIEAVEFRVAMFDKFGRPAEGIFNASHEKTFLHQKAIAPLDSVQIFADVPWHNTVGLARITIVQYVLQNGRIVVPPNPTTVVVER